MWAIPALKGGEYFQETADESLFKFAVMHDSHTGHVHLGVESGAEILCHLPCKHPHIREGDDNITNRMLIKYDEHELYVHIFKLVVFDMIASG